MQFQFAQTGPNEWVSPAVDGKPESRFFWGPSKMQAGIWTLLIGKLPGCCTIYRGTGPRNLSGTISLLRFRAGCRDCIKKSPLTVKMVVPADEVMA